MESHIATADEFMRVGEAYWNLSDPALICSPNFPGPDMSQIVSGKFTPILCTEGDEVLGVMLIKEQNHGIYYPVMKGDYSAVLESMVECAQDNYDHLAAQTDNEFIHELAESIDRPMTRKGSTLVWSK